MRGQYELAGIMIVFVVIAVVVVLLLAETDPSGNFKRILGIAEAIEEPLEPIEPTCTPTEEICDGIDNDCDKIIDEGGICDQEQLQITNIDTYSSQYPKDYSEPKIIGYTIKLIDKSIIRYKLDREKELSENKELNTLSRTTLQQEIINYRENLLIAHEETKNKIREILPSKNIIAEYKNAFNGFLMDISSEEVKEIEKLPEVEKIYPQYEVKPILMDSIPLINADDVWNLQDSEGRQITGEGIIIAIIDTGVDYTHPDLGGCFGSECKVVDGWDFAGNDNDPMDEQGHGTHVAATAAGNGILKGVAPDATIYAYRVCDFSGCPFLMAGVDRALDPNDDGDFSDHVDIIQMSIGGYGDPNDPFSQQIDNAVDAGVVAVIAAGNAGPEGREDCRHSEDPTGASYSICSPGTARKAITVAASDKNDVIAGFSSRGPTIIETAKPDISAPGVNICAAQWDSAWESYKCFDSFHIAISGTSMAAPHVSGAAALLKQAYPDALPEDIKFMLMDKAIDIGFDAYSQGAGRLDILESININVTSTLQVRIDYIGEASGIIDVNGTANGTNFSKYILEIGEGIKPTSWNLLIDSNTPVINGILYHGLDTILLKEETSSLRLTVEDTEGNIRYYKIVFFVNNYKIKITSPKNGDVLKAITSVEISGIINGFNITSYIIEYGLGSNPIEWIKIGEGVGEISGVLATWDVTQLVDNEYTLKIRISNDYYDLVEEDFVRVILDNVYIDYPIEDDIIKAGNVIEITGNIMLPDFVSYDVYYIPHSTLMESREGIILINNGSNPIHNNTIAYWNTSNITKADYYDLVLNISNSSGTVIEVVNNIYLDPSLHDGWPVNLFDLGSSNYPNSHTPVIANIDGGLDKEIIVLTGHHVWIFKEDGSLLENWPQSKGCWSARGGLNRNPSVGDIDGDGENEILITDFSWWNVTDIEGLSCEYCAYAWNADGTPVDGWPIKCEDYRHTDAYLDFGSFVLSDLNNDGKMEAIVNYIGDSIQNAETLVLKYDGTKYGNFPFTYEPSYEGEKLYSFGTPAVGDVDCDGEKEIVNFVLGWDPYIFIISKDATLEKKIVLPSWWIFKQQEIILSDLDNDCDLEIIINPNHYEFHIIHHTGEPYENGSVYIPDTSKRLNKFSGGELEPDNFGIVFGKSMNIPEGWYDENGSVGVLNLNGSIKWQKTTDGSVLSQPTIVDINNDGYSEIFVSSFNGKIYGFDYQGNNLEGFPKPIYSTFSEVIIDDIDGDNYLELVVVDLTPSIFVWDLEGTYSPYAQHWPQFQHDAQHTGLYTKPFICGDINRDGDANTIHDLNYLIDYLNRNGTAPDPWQSADLNGDGVISDTDLTILQQFIFEGSNFEPTCKPNTYCGTLPIGRCSGYSYCSEGQFVNRCDVCGCPSGQTCEKVNGVPTCVGGIIKPF